MTIDMPVRGCQYHNGEKDEHGFLVFCGKPAKPEYSYCVEHHRRVYQRVSTSYGPRVPVEAPAEAVEVATSTLEREAA